MNAVFEKKINRLEYRAPEPGDAKGIYKLVQSSKGLDLNSEYCYALLGVHFNETSIVVLDNNKVVAFASGYLVDNGKALFIWQIAVDLEYRKQGIALKILEELVGRALLKNIRFVQFTISVSNYASQELFKRFAKYLGCDMIRKSFFSENLFSNNHEAEDLFVIGPINKR